MINSVRAIRNETLIPSPLPSKESNITRLFEQIQNPRGASSESPLVSTSINILSGGFWSFFLALYSICTVIDSHKLYTNCKVTPLPSDRLEKIGSVVKNIFVDLIGLGGTVAYTVHWAHEARFLSLGKHVTLLQSLGLGSTLITSVIDTGTSFYHIHKEKAAIANGHTPAERKEHKQRLCLNLMKLIGSVTMVAWTALGITTLTLSITFAPLFTGVLLAISGIFSTAAFLYQCKLDKWFDGISSSTPTPSPT